MGISRAPKTWDLAIDDRVNIRPRESLRLIINLDDESVDPTELEFRMDADQDPWPAGLRPLHIIESQEWPFGDPSFTLIERKLYMEIPWSRMQTWTDVKMECQINARLVDSDFEWLVADFSITVARGE